MRVRYLNSRKSRDMQMLLDPERANQLRVRRTPLRGSWVTHDLYHVPRPGGPGRESHLRRSWPYACWRRPNLRARLPRQSRDRLGFRTTPIGSGSAIIRAFKPWCSGSNARKITSQIINGTSSFRELRGQPRVEQDFNNHIVGFRILPRRNLFNRP